MSDLTPLFPRRQVPELTLPLVGGGQFELASERPKSFSLLVFYRGLHCPICKMQLRDLEAKIAEFDKRGTSVLAISTDVRERAEQTRTDWGLAQLRLAYGLPLEAGRRWGLYVSEGRPGTSEPAYFTEPALYLVRPEGTLYFGSVQTMPFARPHFADILSAIDFVRAKNYPARGEVGVLAR